MLSHFSLWAWQTSSSCHFPHDSCVCEANEDNINTVSVFFSVARFKDIDMIYIHRTSKHVFKSFLHVSCEKRSQRWTLFIRHDSIYPMTNRKIMNDEQKATGTHTHTGYKYLLDSLRTETKNTTTKTMKSYLCSYFPVMNRLPNISMICWLKRLQ